jgi:hypothetical protein
MSMPVDQVQQFVVQFACRTPTRKDISPAERKALENVLKDSNRELFQLFSDETARNSPYLFQASRQHNVDAVTVTVPSLILTNDSVTLLAPVRLGGRFLLGSGETLETSVLNKSMVDILVKVQDAIRGLRFNRAGKIFELLLGPYDQEDKGRIFEKLISTSMSLSEIGELDLAFARYTDIDGRTYNIKSVIKYQQMNLADRFQLGVRVDINNRKLGDRLDPRDIEKVWGLADQQIWNHLESILVY